MVGTDVGSGIREWFFPQNINQSTTDGRNGSNACTCIALNFGSIYQQFNLTAPLRGQNLKHQWQEALHKLFDGLGINVAVDDATDAAGDHCQIGGIL